MAMGIGREEAWWRLQLFRRFEAGDVGSVGEAEIQNVVHDCFNSLLLGSSNEFSVEIAKFKLTTVLDGKNLWNVMWSMIVVIPSTMRPSIVTIGGCLTAWWFFNSGYYSWGRYINSIGESIRSTGPIVQWIDESSEKMSALTHRRVCQKIEKSTMQ